MKLKNELYRCGECKLKNRTLLRDGDGNYTKDSIGHYVYDTFTSDSHEEMAAHLEHEHQIDKKNSDVCWDCAYYYSFDNLPIGYDSAGGLLIWCYDCSQRRCLEYGSLRGSIVSILQKHNVPISRTMSDDELLKLLKELLDS